MRGDIVIGSVVCPLVRDKESFPGHNFETICNIFMKLGILMHYMRKWCLFAILVILFFFFLIIILNFRELMHLNRFRSITWKPFAISF